MKKLIKFVLKKISRVIFFITPEEFKPKVRLSTDLDLELKYNLIKETLSNFKEDIKNSIILNSFWKVREYAIKTSLLNDKNKEYYYLEFGVFEGSSTNFFSKFVNKFYCFDSFEGLEEDWVGSHIPKGHFNRNKKIPKLHSNVEVTVGWIENTLDGFLKKHNPKINFIHIDVDTYKPTKFILEKIKPYLVKDAIILFDELYNFVGWENGEYKALNEVFNRNEYRYKAFNLNGVNCCIQIK